MNYCWNWKEIFEFLCANTLLIVYNASVFVNKYLIAALYFVVVVQTHIFFVFFFLVAIVNMHFSVCWINLNGNMHRMNCSEFNTEKKCLNIDQLVYFQKSSESSRERTKYSNKVVQTQMHWFPKEFTWNFQIIRISYLVYCVFPFLLCFGVVLLRFRICG